MSLSDEATDTEVILSDLLRSLDRIISVNVILLDITFIELDRSVGWQEQAGYYSEFVYHYIITEHPISKHNTYDMTHLDYILTCMIYYIHIYLKGD